MLYVLYCLFWKKQPVLLRWGGQNFCAELFIPNSVHSFVSSRTRHCVVKRTFNKRTVYNRTVNNRTVYNCTVYNRTKVLGINRNVELHY